MRFFMRAGLAAVTLVVVLVAASAQETPQKIVDPKAVERDDSMNAGLAAATRGPARVALVDEASLQLPADEAFIPKNEGLRILRALGNSPEAEGMVGLVIGLRENDDWIVYIRHVKEGYVKDDDAKTWSADELLDNLKQGLEEENKDRLVRGFPEWEAVGWIEKPTYDSVSRRLVWSLAMRRKEAPSGETTSANYNTFVLGRNGYFSLNMMLTDAAKVEGLKPVAATLLANLSYNQGKRYEDFDASTDQGAAYGLAALVGGVAAKKLGLLAVAAAFFAKFAKLILVAVAGLGVAVTKFFGRRKA